MDLTNLIMQLVGGALGGAIAATHFSKALHLGTITQTVVSEFCLFASPEPTLHASWAIFLRRYFPPSGRTCSCWLMHCSKQCKIFQCASVQRLAVASDSAATVLARSRRNARAQCSPSTTRCSICAAERSILLS